MEWLACQQNPLYFFSKYVYIEDSARRRKVKWEAWPYLVDLLNDFENHSDIVILKARQLGISWLVCGYAVWTALFHDNAKVLLLSYKEEGGSWELIDHCQFIVKNLPKYLQRQTDTSTRSTMSFKENDSKIKALPSTEDAGSGFTASLVIRDELELHPFAKENFTAVGPTVDSGGKMIDLASVKKDRLETHFKTRFKEALAGLNGAHPVFLGWRLRPVRDESLTLDEWFESKVRRKYPKHIVEQEYPMTIEEALSPVSVMAFFNFDVLNQMLNDKLPPIEERQGGMVKIWKKPMVGRKYMAALDPSDGGEDPHCSVVMDAQTYEVVAQSWGKCPAEQCASIFDSLVREYGEAFNEFELNSLAGGKVAQTLDDLGTPNRRQEGKSKDGKLKHGWWTGNTSRNTMLFGLEEAIRNHHIILHDTLAVQELMQFIRPPEGNPCPPAGGHDDYVMALALAWQIRREMPTATRFRTGYCVGYGSAR